MKAFRNFCVTTTLTLSLALSVSAGDMAGPGLTSQPPRQQTSITGEISGPGATATGDIQAPGALDPVTEAALSLLQSLMSLF
jgi:hypothetical protein